MKESLYFPALLSNHILPCSQWLHVYYERRSSTWPSQRHIKAHSVTIRPNSDHGAQLRSDWNIVVVFLRREENRRKNPWSMGENELRNSIQPTWNTWTVNWTTAPQQWDNSALTTQPPLLPKNRFFNHLKNNLCEKQVVLPPLPPFPFCSHPNFHTAKKRKIFRMA